MMIFSVVLEDWAIHELIKSPRHRNLAVVLVASSYVTWTYQTHTFSNSVETLVVAWSLVMIQRIRDDKVRFYHRFRDFACSPAEFSVGLSNDPHFFPLPFSALSSLSASSIASHSPPLCSCQVYTLFPTSCESMSSSSPSPPSMSKLINHLQTFLLPCSLIHYLNDRPFSNNSGHSILQLVLIPTPSVAPPSLPRNNPAQLPHLQLL